MAFDYNGDHLGSASTTTNASRTVIHQARTFPFGGQRWSTGSDPSDIDFTGQRRDSFGLLDYNARYFDPAIGRFISADTIVPDFANPQDLNRYSYVRNNPLKYTDPSGHLLSKDGAAGGGNALMWAAVFASAGYSLVVAQADLPDVQVPSIELPSVETYPLPDEAEWLVELGPIPDANQSSGVMLPIPPYELPQQETPLVTPDLALDDPADFFPPFLTADGTSPTWPNTAEEMDEFIGFDGTRIPDGPNTSGRNKVIWQPTKDIKITFEGHPYHPNAPDWHRDPHWHLDSPAGKHQRYLPGDPIPGY